MQNDYIDFKFGDHWASEFNLLAVSSSDRYTPPVYGSVNPNIATIMGKKGVYKWKTQVNEKIFNINIAFDSVTIAQLNQIKQWLQPNKIQKLIFSEEPYKYYWAALNAEIDFSHLPFIEGEKQVGERTIIEGVYKGEMVISFVCIDNDGYSTEGTFEGLETENPSSTIKGNDFVLTDADNDYIDNLKIEGKSEQETKYNNTLSDTDFADVNSRSVEKAWKTNNLAQIQAKNGEVTISAPYQYSGIAQEQREALIDHKYFASAEINTDSLDTALEIAGKNITNSIEGKDINITDGLVGPVDDLIVSGDASQDKLYNNEINSSFLEDLDNWDNQNNGKATISKQKATVIANEKYDGVSQYIEENNVGDKYYVRTKVQSNNTETALEVETEKGSAEGSSITINDASDNKLENIRIEGKHSQEHYDQKDLGEGEIISYNNADNYERYTKISVSGNSAQEVVEEVPGTEVEGESITAQDITLPKGRIGVYGNSKQESRSGKNLLDLTKSEALRGGTIEFKESSIVAKPDGTIAMQIKVPCPLEQGDYFVHLEDVSDVNLAFRSVSGESAFSNVYVSKAITLSKNLDYLIINIATLTDEVEIAYDKLYINEGNTDLGYEPYGATPSPEYSSPIKVLGDNTNLFNALDNFSARTIIGLTVTPISNDSIIKINGTATADTFSFIGNDIMDIFENGKTYYAYTNNENFEVLFELYGVDIEVPIKTVDNFVMNSEYTRINLVFKGTNLNGKTYNNEEIGIKIEEGKITKYSPYGQGSSSFIIANGDKTQKQEFVLPIQKPMLKEDYFDFKNKKEIHSWSKTIFTGEEKWALNATYTNTIRFSLGVSYLNANKIGYCNRSFIRTTQAHGDYEYMFYNSDLLYFNILKSSLPADKQNLEGFTELLKQWNNEGKPLELYYQTGEIEELILTDEQIAVGQQIDKAKLYLGTTNIYSDDEIAPYFTLVYNHILPSPSPEAPSEIQNIRDSIKIKLSNQDGSKTKRINFPLSEGQKLMQGDYLADDGIHHVRKQVELDGTDFSLYSNQVAGRTIYKISAFSNNNNFKTYDSSILCNILKQGTSSNGNNYLNNNGSSGSLYVSIENSILGITNESTEEEKLQALQNLIAKTGFIYEGELAEEEIEEYTETQKEIYNNLTHLIMYNGQNTLSSSNELKPQLKWEIPESPSPDYPIEVNAVGQKKFKINAFSNNFLNTNNINFNYSALGINVKSNTDGSLKISGTAIKNGYFAVQVQTEFFKPLKKGTRLTLNFGQNKKLLRDGRLKVFAWTYDKNNVSGGLLNSATSNYSIILSTDVTKITWGIEDFVQGTIYNDDIYITLNSEEEINSYIKNKQEISNIECQRDLLEGDYINLNDNNETHIWNYKELDGTENWQLNSANTFVILNFDNMEANVGLCSHYKMATEGVANVDYGFVISPTILYIKNKDINTIEEFKSWLTQQKNAGNPIKIYWKRSEIQKLPLTTEQKTELQKLRSYREITNINSNDILQPNMEVEYIKKSSYTIKLTGNTEELLSLIYQTNIDKTKILLNNISDNDNSFTFTHPILINLTKQFGSGKEPTKEWLDTNVDFWDVAEGGAPSVETSSRVKTVGSNINLFDPDNHIELDGQYRHYSEGKIANSANFFGIKVPVLGNTVYSVNSNLSRGGYSNLCYYNKDSAFMWGEPFTEGQTFRTPFNCRYITLALNKNYDWFTLTYGEIPIQKVDYNLANIDMQISGYDSQFKSFPLAKGQELLQLSDGTQDTLEADGIHKRVGKVEITGNENWSQYNRQLHTYFGAAVRITGTKAPIFCNRLIANNGYVYYTTGEAAACLQDGYLYMCIKRKDFGANDSMSVDECLPLFKQFLKDEHNKGNSFIYYYKRMEEEIIPYSNAQKAWYDEFEIYRKNTQITTIAETKPWYSFTYDINDTYSVNSTKVNEYEKLGLIFNNLEDRPRFIVNRTAEGSGMIKMRKPLVVDLTNVFGAGKEPDLAWCLENITFDNSCEYGTPSPNVPSELISVGSNPIKIENKSRNLIKEQNLLNWTREYCIAERLTEKYDNRNIYRISFENHKKGTINTRIQQKKGNMVFSIYARVIQADDPTVNRLVVAKITSDSSSSTPVSYKSLENLIGEWQKIYIPITAESIDDAAELVLEVQHNADTDDSTIIDLCMPQLEEGFTPHDYIPYAPEKINNLTFTTPLRQLKNGVRDEFSKDGIIRRVGEHTIKSSDTVYWIVFNQDKSYITICGQLGVYVRGDSSWNAPSFYCNRIEDCTSLYRIAQAKNPAPSRTKEGIGIIDSEYRMCLRADLMGIVETDTEEDMIRKYKVLLDEKPFTIYYEKEVADIEPLTELQKNTLANLVTRKQYDHWLVSGDLNPEVELSYKLTSSINDIHPWVTGSNLLDKTWFYNDNNIHTKPYVEVDTGDADKSGISATRPIYLLNSGTETANLSLTFDYINIETPLIIQTYSGKFTDDGFVEEVKVSEITIEPFTNYQPFKDIYDNNPANWKIEIDSTLGEVYLRHNTDKTKVLNLNRFNKDHTFLSLADCNFVDYDKVFPTIISEIEGTAIENTIFNKVTVANTADNYRLKNVNIEWKHTYL